MAEDYTTSPVTRKGQILYGLLIGVLAAALRLRGIEEAVVYAVIVGNMAAPLIERITVPRAFGQKKMVRVHNDKNDSAA